MASTQDQKSAASDLSLETEAKKLVCPISIYTGKPQTCLGSSCVGWKTTSSQEIKSEIADGIFLEGMAYTELMTGENESHAYVIRNGLIIHEKWNAKKDPTVLKVISHDEIMNEKFGMRKWLEVVRKRRPMAIEHDGSRNIQYNTEEQKFYHIYDEPLVQRKGYCAVIYDK